MAHSLLPAWFLGYGTFLELLFFVITALIAFYAWKVYKITGKENARGMFVAFTLFSSSYLVMILAGLLDLMHVIYIVPPKICDLSIAFSTPIVLVHMILYLAGLARLGTSVFNISNKTLYYLVTAIMSVALILASDTALLFNTVSIIILLFIAYQIFVKYYNSKNNMILYFLMFVILLLIGRLHYFIASHDISCAFNHALSFIAHGILFIVVFMVMKHGFKKR